MKVKKTSDKALIISFAIALIVSSVPFWLLCSVYMEPGGLSGLLCSIQIKCTLFILYV